MDRCRSATRQRRTDAVDNPGAVRILPKPEGFAHLKCLRLAACFRHALIGCLSFRHHGIACTRRATTNRQRHVVGRACRAQLPEVFSPIVRQPRIDRQQGVEVERPIGGLVPLEGAVDSVACRRLALFLGLPAQRDAGRFRGVDLLFRLGGPLPQVSRLLQRAPEFGPRRFSLETVEFGGSFCGRSGP